jgi:RHS repeat-associated protein
MSVGNRLSMTEMSGAALVRKTDFAYDRANRLSSVAFDSDGSGTADETVKYAYEAGGQRTQLILPDGKTVSYSYDARGRLTGLSDWSGQTASYSYDGASRVASRTANGMTTSSSYDVAGRLTLLKHMNGGSTTRYTLDLGLPLWETLVETRGANVTRYVHDPRGLLAQQRPDASWQWALNDGLGSLRGLINSSQSPQESRLYAPYGDAIQLSGTAQSGYGFTGEPTDGNSLVYLRARYYRPAIGQFISRDPLDSTRL